MSKTGKRKSLEPKRILNVEESRNQEKNWRWSDIAGATRNLNKLPEAVDLRGDRPSNWWGRVENQGSTGACVGYALGTIMHWHLEKEGHVSRGRRGKPSFRHIWMASKESDRWVSSETSFLDGAGTYLDSALEVVRKRGSVPDKILPMKGGGTLMAERDFYVLASRHKIKSYHSCSFHGDYGQQGWHYWLANHGPILVRLNVDKAFMFARKRTSVLENYGGGGHYGGHACVIAGYKPGYFLVKNSWGTGWGDRGFVWVSELYARVAFTESYGIIL